MNRADACSKFRVGARPCRRRALAPRIVAAGGDGQHPAHRGNCVHGLIRVHELERRDGSEPVSVANQAAAFDSISRSSRSTRFSRRNRLSSSRSAVVSPSLRRPSSSPACLTHLRIALAEASNSRANCATGRPARANSMIRRRYSGAYGGWVLGIGGLLLPFSPTPPTKAGQLQCAKRRPPVSTVANKADAMSSTGIWLGEVRPSGNACANTWRTPRFSRYLITATCPPQPLTGLPVSRTSRLVADPPKALPLLCIVLSLRLIFVASRNSTISKGFFRTMLSLHSLN